VRSFSFLVLVVSIVACRSTPTTAPRLGSEVHCDSCRVILDTVTVLPGVQFLGPSTLIVRDSVGNYYLRGSDDGALKAYDTAGRLLHRVGRPGGGPGEFEVIRNLLIGPDGSLQVLDAALGRRSRFAVSGAFLGSTPAMVGGGMGSPAVMLPDGRIVANVRSPLAARSLAVIAIDGSVSEFNGDSGAVRRPEQWLLDRLLSPRAGGGLLVAHPYSFEVDVYGANLVRNSRVSLPWHRAASTAPSLPPSDGLFDRPFTPQLRAIWEDDVGRLWLLVLVPSDDWTPGPSEQTAARLRQEDYRRLAARSRVETILEVVDIDRGAVLARSRFAGSIGVAFGEGYFSRSVEDSVGEPGLQILKVQLTQ
jgi:hypothetical protein